MKNSDKTTVLTIVVSLLVAFVLVMSGPEGSIINSNYVYAAKAKSSSSGGSSSGGGGGGGSDSGGGGDKGGSKGSSDSGKSSDSSSSDNSKTSDKSGSGGRVDDPNPITPSPNDDGFTNQDGPQPGFTGPIKIGPNPDSSCGKGGHAICLPPHKDFCRTHPGVCHKHHDGGDNVKVIHRTVVVHDRNNTPQTILLNTNTQTGTCFVSSQQVVDVPNLVTQLLNQCTSVTITP